MSNSNINMGNKRSKYSIVTAVIVGAGNRGQNYAAYAQMYPKSFQIKGVAEPREHIRNRVKDLYKIENNRCYVGWEEICLEEKFTDCAIIATQDQQHVQPALALAKKGYHILLEKPMAVTAEDCRKIYEACQEAGVILAVCHVLRYHPSVKKLKELIDSGIIGEVVNINHTERVGHWHFAHSFVRGNWGNESRSTFSLLSKCCHDVDLISYWMGNQQCTKISSFGSLQHFTSNNKPKDAAKQCLDCVLIDSCPYSAKKIYLDPKPSRPRWPMSAVCDIEDAPGGYLASLEQALKNGPYGRCVYDTDNDVCDNQVVNFQFENGSTASLTMIAFTKDVCKRKTHIYGTLGELCWDDGDSLNYSVQHSDFGTSSTRTVYCDEDKAPPGWGHGGADFYLIKSFVEAIALQDKTLITSGAKISLETHLLAFAAEQSRLSNSVIHPQADATWSVS